MASKLKPTHHQDNVQQALAEVPELEQVTWYKDPGLRKLYFYAAIICVASATTGYDGSMLNNIRLMPSWNNYFHLTTNSDLGLLNALYSIGSIASLPIAPYLSDTFGRKSAMLAGCLIMVLGAGIQGGSQNLGMFQGGRFMMGFGNTMAQLSSPLLLTEICHPQHRGKVTAIYNCLWNLGAVVNTWLSFGTKHIESDWSWRVPTIGQGVPSIIQLIFLFWIPESPRWLMSKDRSDEALNTLAKYHANGNMHDATVQFEYVEIKETLRIELEAKKTSSYFDFFKTKGNRYRLMIITSLGLFSQLSGNSLISYYAKEIFDSVGVKDPDAQLGINGGLTIVSLITSVTFAMLCDRFGRRKLFLVATSSMLFCYTLLTILTSVYVKNGNKGAGKGVIAMIWLYSISYAFAWSGLLVAYTVEILPFKLRAKGLMIMNFWVQAALTLGNYTNAYGFSMKPVWLFYMIYNIWLGVELVFVYFTYIETKGPTLEEIAKIFDGDEAEVADVEAIKIGLPDRGGSYSSATEKEPGVSVQHRA